MSIVLKNWIRVSDAVTADPDYFVTAARPNTSATMAQTSLSSDHNGGGRNVTVTTTGSSDGGKTATITGTDTDGASQSEVITLAGSATATAGTKIFLTVTAVEMSAQPAANITVGFGTAAGSKIGGGGVFGSFRTGGTAGTVLATDKSSGTSGGNNGPFSAHGTGAKLVNGMYVTYTVGDFDQIVVFYAG